MSKIITIVTDQEMQGDVQVLAGFNDHNVSKTIRLAVAYAMANAKDFKAWLDKQKGLNETN